jgi:FAD/FMN-containing dehydrogenase
MCLSGWGRHKTTETRVVQNEDLVAAAKVSALCRGLGRSYGDAALPARQEDIVAITTSADRILSFDPATGWLSAEAGISLYELNRLFLPRGWFVPVTPGTQFVTLGGMVAADIHGKNHHVAGCFGEHVRSLRILLADGATVTCSDSHERELFCATIGGMGLTGHILEVEFRMVRIPSPWIWSESERINDLDGMVSALKRAALDWPFTVGWIDCLKRGRQMGRGILMKGRWANPSEAPARPPQLTQSFQVPSVFPDWLMSPLLVRLFNFAFYWKHWRRQRRGIAHPQKFFYPLDNLRDWNRLYGRSGFTQYQCVLPHADDNGPARRFMDRLTSLGCASFLCVIKDSGAEGKGILSFPKSGITIAVDMPVRGSRTQAMVDSLNEVVIAESGRIYLAKDAFARREDFERMEPRLHRWQEVRRRWDPAGRLRSALSVRLLGDHA